MKVLIIYASKWGASREAALMLAQRLRPKAEASVFDIKDNPPSPDGFDAVVIGGSIRMGRLNSSLKKYISLYKDILSGMPSAAFICCGITKDVDDYRIMQLPKDVNFSLGVHCFGGELKPDKIKGFDKLIVKAFRESIRTQVPDQSDCERHELPELLPDTIYALAERICEAQ